MPEQASKKDEGRTNLSGLVNIYKLLLFEFMNNETGTQFRFEPCCLGRHDVAGIGYVHQLLHSDRIKSQCHFHFATVHTAFLFFHAPDTTDKIDTFIRTKIFYT